MSLRNVTGPIYDAEGNPLRGRVLVFKLRTVPFADSSAAYVPGRILLVTDDVDGTFTQALAAPDDEALAAEYSLHIGPTEVRFSVPGGAGDLELDDLLRDGVLAAASVSTSPLELDAANKSVRIPGALTIADPDGDDIPATTDGGALLVESDIEVITDWTDASNFSTIKLSAGPGGTVAGLIGVTNGSGTDADILLAPVAGKGVQLGVGTRTASASLDVLLAEPVRLPRLTTAQRDAITPAGGMILYNTTTGRFEGYEEDAPAGWKNLSG